ncbi:MAG: CYTH domain-containing protein [Candidatus Eisenbacteria sp.]|nr:CYTH domain-containing protein [Candidatus Eisenbacteria bacterium]
MTRLEREIKLALTADEHARLRAAWDPAARVLEQRNYYLDTIDGRLQCHGYGLRLRIEDGPVHTLTLKGPPLEEPAARAAGYSVRTEQEAHLTAEQAAALLRGASALPDLPLHLPAELTGAVQGGELQNLGLLANRRRVYAAGLPMTPGKGTISPGKDGPTLMLELDESRFPDGSRDYELEIELQDLPPDQIPTNRALQDFLAQWAIPWCPRSASKLARFLERRAGGGGSAQCGPA